MDAKDFISQHEDLKDIDIDNITSLMDDCKSLLESNEIELDIKEGDKVVKKCSQLEKYFDLREVKKDEIAKKRTEQKENKLEDISELMSYFDSFSNFFRGFHHYENDEDECEKINDINDILSNLYEKLGELTLKFADGDKVLAKKYFV
jgi:hypothetical protein